jgi:hypothetical protein
LDRAAPQQQNENCEHRQHPDGDQSGMGDAVGNERRQPQCGKRGLFPTAETAGEAVGGDEGDAGASTIIS